jgi:two-component system, response regulator YesN
MNELKLSKIARLPEVLYILESYYTDSTFTVKKWAQALNWTIPYLTKFMRECAGKPPSVLLRDRRLRHAQHLLRETEQPINDVALASGFNDNNYFSRKFKECEGVSPTEWREQYTKQGKF